MNVCEVDNDSIIVNSDIGSDYSNDDHLNNSALWSDDIREICYGDLIMEKCEIMEKIALKDLRDNEVMQIIYCGVYKFSSDDVKKIVDIYGFGDSCILRLMRYGYVKYNSQEIAGMVLSNRFTKLNTNEVIEIIKYGKCGFNDDDTREITGIELLPCGFQIYDLMDDNYVKYESSEILIKIPITKVILYLLIKIM